MKESFELLKATRNLLLKSIAELSLEQVNVIPNGFNNNVAWNIGHIVVTQQVLQYKLSNTPLLVSNFLIEKFKKGTKPEGDISLKEWNELLDLLVHFQDKLQKDYQNGVFGSYEPYMTSYGYEIQSIEEAIQFNNLHEALHLGYVMSMKRLL